MRLRMGAAAFLFVAGVPLCCGLLAGWPWSAVAGLSGGGAAAARAGAAVAGWTFWLLLLVAVGLELAVGDRLTMPVLGPVQTLAAGLIGGLARPTTLSVFTVAVRPSALAALRDPPQGAAARHRVAHPHRRPAGHRDPVGVGESTAPGGPPADPPPFLPGRRPVDRSRAASTLTRPARYPPAPLNAAPFPERPVGVAPSAVMFRSHAPVVGVDAALARPGAAAPVTIGVDRQDRDIHADLSQVGFAGLTGPGAQGAARALLTAALTTRLDSGAPAYRVITTDSDLDTFGLGDLGPVPELIVTATLATAMRHLSAEVLHRAWLATSVEDRAVPPRTVEELRAALPEEQLPALLLITTDPAAGGPALAALLSHGTAYGLGAVLVAPQGRPGMVDVAADGAVLTAGTLHRLNVLTPEATVALLRPRPAVPTTGPHPGDGGPSEATYPLRDYTPAPPPVLTPPPPQAPPPPPALGEQPARADPRLARPVHLQLFGPPQLLLRGSPLTQGLRARAVELMAYLAVHPDGARTGTLIGELLPDADNETRAKNLIYTAIGSLRDLLRTATDQDRTWFILRTGHGYRLDDALIDVDLWQVRAALAAATKAPDRARRRTAITTALATAGGRRLFDQVTWEWADTHILTVHHQLLDASRRLAADLAEDDDTEQALAVLHDALAIDPHAEDLYQQLFRIHARHGDQPALHRAYDLLRARLDDIAARPSRATVDLYTRLTGRPGPHAPRP